MPVTTLVRGRAAARARPARNAGWRPGCGWRCGRSGARARRRRVVFTDDDEIRVLNRAYRRHDRATDVL